MPEKQKPEDKEKEFKYWQERLASEPLRPVEETEKRERYSDNMWSDNMIDPEEIEKDCIKDERGSLQKKLTQLTRDYHRTGLINKEEMRELEKRFNENEFDGKSFKDLEETYDKLKKEVKRNSSKYG